MNSLRFAALIGATLAFEERTSIDSVDIDFLAYLARYNKFYDSVDEFNVRLNLYRAVDKLIREHNATESSYTLGHNRSSDMTAEEKWDRSHGRRGTSDLFTDENTTYHVPSLDTPDSVDWRKHNAVTKVKD